MATATFDTPKFANALKAVGVPDKQAEAEAQVLSEVFSINFREVTTKEDLKRAVADIEVKIREVEQRLLVKIDQTKTETFAKMDSNHLKLSVEMILLRWMFGVVISFLVAMLALLIRVYLSTKPN